ncbi:MAG TPA: gamma-glutamyl-gamma-aminobutyrate hydrolase family protein [Chitinophagales bacterium]|nr:gamma-glutamyl-gamma-aminobutyrate hydrolase family protein [Chitinophagales bacterium]
MKIGLTFTESRWENYPAWIKGNDPNIEIVELHWEKNELEDVWDLVEDCDGIVLTGGVDIHPRFYESEQLEFPNGDGKFNEERDEFEMHVFETALNFNLPVLAICRGLQLVNVALGGDLIQDLEAAGKKNHRRMNDVDDEHTISITDGSILKEVVGSNTGTINGAHHQAIGKLSDELMATATSPDGVIEAIEWKDKTDEPWMVAVQWHPERMKDKEANATSKNIREAFLKEAGKSQ